MRGTHVAESCLIVLDGQVGAGTLKVRDLHEVPSNDRLADVQIVVSRLEVGADATHAEVVHDARELRAHVIGCSNVRLNIKRDADISLKAQHSKRT